MQLILEYIYAYINDMCPQSFLSFLYVSGSLIPFHICDYDKYLISGFASTSIAPHRGHSTCRNPTFTLCPVMSFHSWTSSLGLDMNCHQTGKIHIYNPISWELYYPF